eukprot:PhF_6_TR34146/c1_g1_i2/m.49879
MGRGNEERGIHATTTLYHHITMRRQEYYRFVVTMKKFVSFVLSPRRHQGKFPILLYPTKLSQTKNKIISPLKRIIPKRNPPTTVMIHCFCPFLGRKHLGPSGLPSAFPQLRLLQNSLRKMSMLPAMCGVRVKRRSQNEVKMLTVTTEIT